MGRAGYDDKNLLVLVASRIAVLAPMTFLLAGIQLRAQAVAPPAAIAQSSAAAPAPHFTFDVVSIKPSGPSNGPGGYYQTGYSSIHLPLYWTVFRAYFSSHHKGNQIVGMPEWMMSDPYDIIARVDEADLPAWMSLSYAQRREPESRMLQQLLADRLKLVAHMVPAEVDGYILVVGKHGSLLTPTKPGETYPAGAKDGWDGAKIVNASSDNNNTMSFFNSTVEDLADILSWAWPIIDRTNLTGRSNLTGRYDFTFRRLKLPVDADGKRIPNPQPYDLWDLSATGLEIKPAKIPTQNLVIDHIERPSPN
jgi:uncharacterized protein (TIGR03435 family)